MRRTKELFAGAAMLIALAAVLGQDIVPSERALVEPPTTDLPRDSCVTAECHTNVKSAAVLHGPLHVNACDSCHTLKDPKTHTYEPTRPPETLCLFCHDLGIPEGSLEHKPVTQGECVSCHDPHGGRGPSLLRDVPYRQMCTNCHEEQIAGMHMVHGPASAGACGACHEPHASQHRMLLTADGTEMCLRCHVTTGIEMDTLELVHSPVRDDCEICHDPHATDNAALLKDEPAALCESCHENIRHTVTTARTQHGAVTSERSCLNCHAAHASDRPRMLKMDIADLCFECHDEEIEMPDGSMLANMKSIISTGTSLHGAIAQSNCVACHQIHGGDHSRLLTNEYPSDLYYPFKETIYALCFSCHDKQLVLLPKTETATAFRNGDTNLHFVHVNRDKKGRTCSFCHDAHAANRSKHIHDSVPFGDWMLPIQFEATATGGSCEAGCHRAFRYDREKPVAYPHTGADRDWRGRDLVPGKKAPPDKSDDNDSKNNNGERPVI